MPVPDLISDTADLGADHALLRDAVGKAGALALQFFRGPLDVREKSKGDPVSDADLAVDALLRDLLMKARPDYAWLSEESAASTNREDKRRIWIVDPIDGTRAFVKGEPDFTVCAALVQDGHPVLGVVFAPAHGLFFEAQLNCGARVNNTPIKVSTTQELEDCRMLAAKGMIAHASWQKPWPRMNIENRSSIAYRIALVARGEFDAAITLSPTNEWDLAAAQIILTEAGGGLVTHTGERPGYNKPSPKIRSMIATNLSLQPAIIGRTADVVLPKF